MARQKSPKKPKWICKLYYTNGSPIEYGFQTKRRAREYGSDVLKTVGCLAVVVYKAEK